MLEMTGHFANDKSLWKCPFFQLVILLVTFLVVLLVHFLKETTLKTKKFVWCQFSPAVVQNALWEALIPHKPFTREKRRTLWSVIWGQADRAAGGVTVVGPVFSYLGSSAKPECDFPDNTKRATAARACIMARILQRASDDDATPTTKWAKQVSVSTRGKL